MISKGTLSSLLLAAIATFGCGGGATARPDLPNSVPPGWTLASLDAVPAPAELSSGGTPHCWKGVYSGAGAAQVWVCGYQSETGAFDAEQRTRTDAQTVKFQEGKRLVLVKWSNAKQSDIHALISRIQKRLQ